MTDEEREEIAQRFASDDEVDEAIKSAVSETLSRLGREGHKVVVWLDDRPVWVSPPSGDAK